MHLFYTDLVIKVCDVFVFLFGVALVVAFVAAGVSAAVFWNINQPLSKNFFLLIQILM